MFSRFPVRRQSRRRLSRGAFRPRVELLEARDLPSTVFVVTTTADENDGDPAADPAGPDGQLSLREAIAAANANGNGIIQFNIDGPAGSVFTIMPKSTLPTLGSSILIDGTTQRAFNGGIIELSGAALSEGDGIDIDGANSGVRGLVINNFQSGSAISILSDAYNDFVDQNLIGTDTTGLALAAQPNYYGITVTGHDNTITGNVISGSYWYGIQVYRNGNNNTITGNFIGTDLTGTVALGNHTGVELADGVTNNTVGGDSTGLPTLGGTRNLISGNRRAGIEISGGHYAADDRFVPTSHNLIAGNFIGTDVTGTLALGNDSGVVIDSGASSNTIGGASTAPDLSGLRNLISGNSNEGVTISRYSPFTESASRDSQFNIVAGNFIGTDLTGTDALGNGEDGVYLYNVSQNIIGGATTASGNVISGNEVNGVFIQAPYSQDDFGNFVPVVGLNRVRNNFIGTDMTATLALGNGGDGILVDGSSGNRLISNLVFSNGGPAIELIDGGNDAQVAPLIESISYNGPTLTITWTLNSGNSEAGVHFTFEFFASSSAGNSDAPGQGQQYLGSIVVAADDVGFASGTVTLAVPPLVGPFISATATGVETSDTSPFSAPVDLSSADVAVTATVNDPTPTVGQPVIYTVTVTNNNGPSDATGVSLANVLPAGLMFVSAQATQGTYDPTTATWLVGTLPINASAILTFIAVPQNGTAGTTLSTNALVLTSDQFDPQLANNTATVPIVPTALVIPPLPEPLFSPPVTPLVGSLSSPPAVFTVFVVTPTTTVTIPVPITFPEAGLLETGSSRAQSISDSAYLLSHPDTITALSLVLLRANLPAGLVTPEVHTGRANSTCSITGVIFQDTNGDGVREPGEPALEGMPVYLEQVGVNEYDPSKPVAVTDSNGQFKFDGLAPGSYIVRPVPHRLYRISAPQDGYENVQLKPNVSATVPFGAKPVRAPVVDQDGDARPVPSAHPEMDADVEMRDALFISGKVLPEESHEDAMLWSSLALAGFIGTGVLRLPQVEDENQRAA